MKLLDVLKALSSNNASITIIDQTETALITFNAAGYNSVESDLGTRKVKRIKVDSDKAISVYITDEVISGSILPIGG